MGKTKDIQNRLENHFNDNGSVYTKTYKPTGVILPLLSTHTGSSREKERDETIMQMSVYGIDNVRGAGWSKLIMSDYQKRCEIRVLSALANSDDVPIGLLRIEEQGKSFIFFSSKVQTMLQCKEL